MQVSKRRMKREDWEVAWDKLMDLMRRRKNAVEVEVVLGALLAPNERVMMAKRLMVGVLTLSGWEGQKIAESLKMSRSTVYKYQRYMKLDGEYAQLIKRYFPDKVELYEEGPERRNIDWVEKLMDGKRNRWKLHTE